MQIFKDKHGLTSLPLISAFLIILTAIAGFIWSIFIQYNEGIVGASVFIGSGTALLGIRRFTTDQAPEKNNNNEPNN